MSSEANTGSRSGRFFVGSGAACVFGYIYVPLILLIAFSFEKSSVLAFPMGGWSLRWYVKLLGDAEMQAGVVNSLIVAGSCVLVTCVVGLGLALGLRAASGRLGRALQSAFLLPLIIPQLITGLAFLIIFNRSGVHLSLATVIAGQCVVWMPVVVMQLLARLRSIDANLERASMDLGANSFYTFIYIVLPSIRTAMIGSGLLIFTLAFDELPVTFLLTGSRNTLPMHIWSMLRIGVTPEINAIATVTVGVSIILIVMAIALLTRTRSRGMLNG